MNSLIASFLVLSAPAFARSRKPLDKPFPSKVHMTVVGTCANKDAAKKVYIFKQWHLPPTTITKGFKEKYQQERNQTAIYQDLEEGVKRKKLDLVVSEGCEGEINSDFKPAFNGWDYASLKAQCFQKGYDKILTLIPLKLEAKYGDKINTICGDNDDLVKEGNLHISNLRGWMGFYSRLTEFKDNPEKLKLYSDSAADLLKISKDTPYDKLLGLIKERLKGEIETFRKSLDLRNDAFVKALSEHDFNHAAVVIGGLHAGDLKDKIDKAGMACEVLEPPGYQPEDEKLMGDFERAVR